MDPLFNSGRRIRGFMPIFDEMDRLTNELWNDNWVFDDDFMNNNNLLLTNNNTNNNNNNNTTRDEQKQLQQSTKSSSRHNKRSNRTNNNEMKEKESKQQELTNSNTSNTNTNASNNNSTQLTTDNNNTKNMLSSLWSGMNVNKSISLKVDEENDKYIISASVPNFNKDQLKLQIRDGLLTISGEMIEEKKDEHSYSKSSQFVQRSMRLPDNINEENINAKYDNGVLRVNIPKLDKPKQNKDSIMIE